MSALDDLVGVLRKDGTLISEHIVDPEAVPALGELAAAGPRTAVAGDEYALLFEAIREGYLLHYGNPRIVTGVDADLALLAGDYLYATGLERLAALGDPTAVVELSDLISLSAQVHDDRDRADHLSSALWLASAVAVATGRSPEHEAAKAAVRDRSEEAAELLWAAARASAAQAAIDGPLEAACEAIGFPAEDLS